MLKGGSNGMEAQFYILKYFENSFISVKKTLLKHSFYKK